MVEKSKSYHNPYDWGKPKPRFFITGSQGFLGQYLSTSFHKKGYYVFESHAFHLRLDYLGNLEHILRRLNPDVIIHLAGYHRWDTQEERKTALKINVEGTANLIDIAENLQIPVFFLSTDHVFNGRKDSPYTEKDPVNPVSFFGHLKVRGEEIIQNAALPKSWILRLAPLWSENVHLSKTRQNFLAGIVRSFEGNSQTWPATIYGGHTHVDLVVKAIEGLFEHGKEGIYHLASDTEKSYFEQARYMAQFLGPSKELIADTIRAVYPSPQNFRLNSEKLHKQIDLTIPSFEQDVKRWLLKHDQE